MMTNMGQICRVETCEHPACKEASACKGIEWRNQFATESLTNRAKQLLLDAADLGFVITIEQRPLQPLAMGNSESVLTVRKARHA